MNQYAFNIYYIVDSDTCQYKGNAMLHSMATVVLCTVPTLHINFLTPNVNYSGRTALLTSKVAFYIVIQQI